MKPDYEGYLSPYLARIESLHRAGADRKYIARVLFSEGARSPHYRGYWSNDDHMAAMAAMVGYVLRPDRPRRIGAKWQTWTAEDQSKEFEEEYRRWS
jgi:hypothetical protein